MANAFEFAELSVDDERWRSFLSGTQADIYHLPEYVALEASRSGSRPAAALVTWSGGSLLVPYLVRALPYPSRGVDRDAMSPYGYSGALLAGDADRSTLEAATAALFEGMRESGYCSLFLRMHPILDAANGGFERVLHLTGETVVVDLDRSPDELWRGLRKSARRDIRRARDRGLTFEMRRPEGEDLATLAAIYEDTMTRVNAAASYFDFDLSYFDRLAQHLGDRLDVSTVSLGERTLCAGISSRMGAVVQSLLGGTRSADLKLHPSVLEIYGMLSWYQERGARIVNLGGGLGAERDSLFRFKQAFSHLTRPFFTGRIVLDRVTYDEQARLHASANGVSREELDQGFFPAYRAPVREAASSTPAAT